MIFHSDSELVVWQVRGEYEVKIPLLAKGPFVLLKMTYRKMFSAFSGVCFAENKWSTENIFLVNWKSSHFSVKCFTDLKNVKHFTSFFFSFFFRKMFSRKSFFRKHFPESDFPWNKRNLNFIWLLSKISLDHSS